jgi:hypothetical protein
MSLFRFVYIVFLFTIVSPGILIKLPNKGSPLLYILCHGILFVLLYLISNRIFFRISEGIDDADADEDTVTATIAINKTPPNPSVLFNEDATAPRRGQFVVDPKLVPAHVCADTPITAGDVKIRTSKTVTNYVDDQTYKLGNLVKYTPIEGDPAEVEGVYINLAANEKIDKRGNTGTYKQSPGNSPSVWKKVTIAPGTNKECRKAMKTLNKIPPEGSGNASAEEEGDAAEEGGEAAAEGGGDTPSGTSGDTTTGKASSKKSSSKGIKGYRCTCSIKPR